MLKKSKVTKKWYSVESLTEAEKIKLGFDLEELKKELSKVPESVKKSPVQNTKNLEAGQIIIGKPTLGEVKNTKKKKKAD